MLQTHSFAVKYCFSPLRPLVLQAPLGSRHFTCSLPRPTCQSHQSNNKPPCSSTQHNTTPARSLSGWSATFWSCRATWRRAGINTLRCLVGCTIGDFSALWTLQSYYPELGVNTIMLASSKNRNTVDSILFEKGRLTQSFPRRDIFIVASGITTSIILETWLLRRGADQLSWSRAARTAMGMSMVSMVAMEIAENAVDYHLTGGVIAFEDPKFWAAAVLSIGAGYLAPLPYNYLRLKKYGKACH
ncbi:hypothetical protein PDE_03749 [Penicillium oxalicum 114-2]|uniref:DUF4396 domain-containing protein n=1 Tax=Penicillium oxalicum (strain 114-2 / CGMCC 5302) TaxID=933388 RepID=S8AS09_PENO1|nr:hypothetical protein PDE_03749 [Penicillium oxalicum 114-2]